jgi:predicted DNA-binding transcriptional regulator AlpA
MPEQSIENLTVEIRKLTAAVAEQNKLIAPFAQAANTRVSAPGSQSHTGNPAAPLYPPKSAQPSFLTEAQVATTLGMSLAAVRKWRFLRRGPQFIKLGRAVRYDRRKLEEWVDRQQRLAE